MRTVSCPSFFSLTFLLFGFWGNFLFAALPPVLVKSCDETMVALAVATEAPYGADAAGGADSTASLQRAIDAVAAANGGVVFIPAGRYRLAGGLKVAGSVTLAGASPEAGPGPGGRKAPLRRWSSGASVAPLPGPRYAPRQS